MVRLSSFRFSSSNTWASAETWKYAHGALVSGCIVAECDAKVGRQKSAGS
jgi:hypothetical protein